MLPSISPSLASPASGGAAAASSPPAGPAALAAPARKGVSVGDVLDVVDTLAGVAVKVGLLPKASATKATKPKSTAAGYAKSTSAPKSTSKASTSKATSAAAKKPGPLAFLDDSKLSVEDKLMRLLAYLNDKWEKDIQKKLKEIGDAEKATSSSSAKKSGGVLGSLGKIAGVAKVAKQFFPAVGIALDVLGNPAARAVLSKVGGPVLAAAASAVGLPQLAPVALRYGSELVDLAAGVATSLEAEKTSAGASGGTAAKASSGGSDGAGLSSDRKAQLKLMEVQRVLDQQREMFSLVSNMLRSRHDTRMAVVQNVR